MKKRRMQGVVAVGIMVFGAINAHADDVYGRSLLCRTASYSPVTREVETRRFFKAAMNRVSLEFVVVAHGRIIRGEGQVDDEYGRFEIRDTATGETSTWADRMRSAHAVSGQSFSLALGDHFSVACVYAIPIGP